MQTTSDGPASSWLRPEFARFLAPLWVAGLALVYLVHYQAWLLPIQLIAMVNAAWPSFHIGPLFREFWVSRAYDAVCVVGIVGAAFGLGATVIGWLIGRRDALGALFALALGFWLLAVLVLVVGMVAIGKVPQVFLVWLCWLLPPPRKFIRELYVSTEKLDGWTRLIVWVLALAVVLNLAGALAPPFEYDELEYHLGALADYQRAGHIGFLPHNFYSNLPQLTEMLYLLAMTTTSDIAAKLLHWLFGVLGALAVYGLAQRLWSRRAGILAAALFYCLPFVQDLSQTARVDLATAFFGTLALGALVLWNDESSDGKPNREQSWVWLSALCAGATVATKWTAIPVVLLPAVAMLVWRRRFLLVPGYCVVAGIIVMPWLVKNWWLTANPVYPLFYGWFPGAHWSAPQGAVFAARHYPTFDWEAVGQFFMLPWNFSFVEARAVPLLLMTTPLVLLLPRAGTAAARWAAGLFVGAYAGWFCFTFRPWRFLFAVFGIAALAGAFAVEKLAQTNAGMNRRSVGRIMMHLCLGAVLMVNLASLALNDLIDAEDPGHVPPQMSFATYALGQFSRNAFVARMGRGVLEPVIWMNENLPSDAKVLYVGEARAYYATHPTLWSTAFDQHPLTAMSRKATTAGELRAALRAEGITHVYVNYAELNRLQRGYHYLDNANWELIDEVLKNQARNIHEFGRRVVYELVSSR